MTMTHMTTKKIVLAAAAVASALLASDPAAAARGVNEIIADHITALGGKAALARHKTLVVKRKITIKGMGMEGLEERYAASGDRFLSMTSIPGIGTVKQGSDGKTFWSEDPINGLRLLSGAEKAQARIDGSWNAELRLTELYKSVAVVPAPESAPKGVALECLELTPGEGRPMTVCFDASSHRRVFQAGRQTTPQGEIPFSARFSDWKTFDGISLPTFEETTAGPTTIEARVSEVKFGEKLDPGLFKLKRPAASKAKAPAASRGAPGATP